IAAPLFDARPRTSADWIVACLIDTERPLWSFVLYVKSEPYSVGVLADHENIRLTEYLLLTLRLAPWPVIPQKDSFDALRIEACASEHPREELVVVPKCGT